MLTYQITSICHDVEPPEVMPAHPSANLDWTTAAQLLLFYIYISPQGQPSPEGGDADKEVDEELG